MYGLSALLMWAPAVTAKEAVGESTHSGKIVTISAEKLVMTGKDDKEHGHALALDIRITLDGKSCKFGDLAAGTRIRVTTKDDAKGVATRIEALDQQREFVNAHDGKVVTMTDGVLVMTNKDGKDRTCTLGTDAKVTCDGVACKSDDLKQGMKIRVTIASDGKRVVTRIEALDKNANFEKLN